MKHLLRQVSIVFCLGITGLAIGSPLNTNGVWSDPSDEYKLAGAKRSASASVKARWNVLKSHVGDPSAPRLFGTLGRELYSQGYFTDAIECFSLGWESYKGSTDHDVKMFADLCGAELAQMYARVGRMQDLQAFLKSTEKRQFIGQANALIDNSYSGLADMLERPEISFKCGPYALESFIKSRSGSVTAASKKIIESADSPSVGFSLSQVCDLSNQLGLNLKPYSMAPGAEIIVPSVVHWKLNHFAAIVEKRNGKYLISDPTFGQKLLVTEDAIRQETDGFFLMPEGNYRGYSLVEGSLAERVHGKGNTGGPSKGGTYGSPEVPQSCPAYGMATYSISVMPAGLKLTDTPIFYTPPYGPQMDFTLSYNQRDEYDAVMYNVSNFGHQWGFNWLSYLEYDTAQPQNIEYAHGGGGGVLYSTESTPGGVATTFETASYGSVPISISTGSSPSSTRQLKDGTIEEFNHVVSVGGTKQVWLLTKRTDPHGQSVTINYDPNSHLITTIVDAAGGVSTFCYTENGSGQCLPLVRSITDPYGRTAYFEYDSLYRLKKITDILGLESSFTYSGDGSFVEKLTTPYGDTFFEREATNADTPHFRYIQATDPEGEQERVEYHDELTTDGLYPPTTDYPDLAQMDTNWQRYRNSFYWNKIAMKSAPGDFHSAVRYHFLHTDGPRKTSRLVETLDKPLEGPIYYCYSGQIYPAFEAPAPANTGDNPTTTSRRLDNNDTQNYIVEYNALGNPTKFVDPIGREVHNIYASNARDVTATLAKINGSLTTTSEMLYDNNHRMVWKRDSSGSETTVTYHSTWGVPLSIENALHEITSYDYTTTGLLKRIVQPDNLNYVEFEYGKYDQVTSATWYPECYTLLYDYDVFNRLVRTTYPDGTSTKNVYDKLDLASQRGRLNQWSIYKHDSARRLTSYTNAANETMQYAWCSCGSLERIIDAEGRTTSYDYDVQGRLTSSTLPATLSKTYHYEPLSGRLVRKVDPKGQWHCTAYNNDNTVSNQWISNVPAGTAAATQVSFSWDSDLRRVSSWGDNGGTTTISYKAIETDGAGKIATIDGPLGNDSLSYEYDKLGRIRSSSEGQLTYNSLGAVIHKVNDLVDMDYEYLPHSKRLSSMISDYGTSTIFTYKPVARDLQLDTIYNHANYEDSSYTYNQDAVGRILNWDQQRNSDTLYGQASYDRVDRLVDWSVDSNNQALDYHWLYDKAGNRLSAQTDDHLQAIVSREKFSINNKDQITTSASGGALHVEGTLDRPGTIVGSVNNFVTRPNNSFSGWIDAISGSSATLYASDFSSNSASLAIDIPQEILPARLFNYDENGNMLSMLTTEADGVTTSNVKYEWNSRDQLVAIVAGTHRSEFSYDGLGRRIRIKELENANVQSDISLLWDGLSIVKSGYISNGNFSVAATYYEDGLVDELSGKAHLYFKDHLGSIRTIGRTSLSAPEVTYDYDSFGNITKEGEVPGINEWLVEPTYTGHLYHSASGLYLAPYRVYDARIGRWLSREPLGVDGPNLYHYVFNDPVNSLDPTGLADIDWSPKPGRKLTLDGPTYGNWGGRRWSGGASGGHVGAAPPVDSADVCYRDHDNAYSACDAKYPYGSPAHDACIRRADKKLVRDLISLPADPKLWPLPPTPGTEDSANSYRHGAEAIFY